MHKLSTPLFSVSSISDVDSTAENNSTFKVQKCHEICSSSSCQKEGQLINKKGWKVAWIQLSKTPNEILQNIFIKVCAWFFVALFFKEYIDETIDPCDDFYQFTCGNFIKNTVIPADMSSIDTFSITQKQVMNELIDQMKEEIKPDEVKAFAKLKMYYKNCMNESEFWHLHLHKTPAY